MPNLLAGESDWSKTGWCKVTDVSMPSDIPGTGSPWRCSKSWVFLKTPNPRAVTEFSSTNDEWLSGAQSAKWNTKKAACLQRSRELRINVASRADHEKGLLGGWHHHPPPNNRDGGMLFIFNRMFISIIIIIKWPDVVSNKEWKSFLPHRVSKQTLLSAQHPSGTVQGPGDTGNKPVSALMAFILWVYPLYCWHCVVRMENVLSCLKK